MCFYESSSWNALNPVHYRTVKGNDFALTEREIANNKKAAKWIHQRRCLRKTDLCRYWGVCTGRMHPWVLSKYQKPAFYKLKFECNCLNIRRELFPSCFYPIRNIIHPGKNFVMDYSEWIISLLQTVTRYFQRVKNNMFAPSLKTNFHTKLKNPRIESRQKQLIKSSHIPSTSWDVPTRTNSLNYHRWKRLREKFPRLNYPE